MAGLAIGGGVELAEATTDTAADNATEPQPALTVQSTASQAPHITDRPQLAFATKSTSRILPGGFFDEEQLIHVLTTTAKCKSTRNRNDSNQLQAAMMASPDVESAAGVAAAVVVAADGVSQNEQHPLKQQPAITTTTNNNSTATTDDPTSCSDLNSGYNDEKCDADPENSLKSGSGDPLSPADTATTTGDELSPIQSSGGDQSPDQASPATAAAAAADTSVASASDTSKSSLAFTIDFGDSNGNGGASASGALNNKKYNEIFERFQRRHQRGASMSKLEDAPTAAAAPRPSSKPPLRKATTTAAAEPQTIYPKVQLRDKSRLSRRDCSSAGSEQRHSWSPRNSSAHPSTTTTGGCRQTMVLDEPLVLTAPPPASRMQRKLSTASELALSAAPSTSTPKTTAGFQPKSATLQIAFETIKTNFELSQQRIISPPQKPSESAACEPAVEPIPCPVAPLEFRQTSACSGCSSVSEAGTYTLDGDNYTEEQKEQMSIDKLAKLSLKTTDTAQTIQPSTGATQLATQSSSETKTSQGKSSKPKPTSYLERIKSKVRNISDRTFHKNQQLLPQTGAAATSRVSPDVELPPQMSQFAKLPAVPLQPPTTLDLGNFTSITSAGAFNKPAVAAAASGCKPTTSGRKSSLTQFQIDNSEYIQHQGTTGDEAAHLNSFTDYEKARHHDYQLNIFKTGSGGEHAAALATSTTTTGSKTDSFGLGQAETKYDWIQEWAKNARRNTKKSASLDQAQTPSQQQHAQSQPQHRAALVNSQSAMAFECGATNGGGSSQAQTPSAHNANNSSSDFSDINQNAVAHRRTMLEYHAQEANRYADDLQRLETQSSRRSRQASESPQRMRKLQQQQHRAAFSSTTSASEFGDEEDAQSEALSSPHHHQQQVQQQQQRSHQHGGQPNSLADSYSSRVSRPPLSPSKIPSPMHSLSSRPRSASVNRSLHSSVTDLDSMSHANDDTGMYLHKTAAAISQLQSLHHHHHRHNSPQSPSSPQHQQQQQLYASNGKIASNFQTSPSVRRHYKHSPFATLSPEHRLPPLGSPTHHHSASHHGSSTSLHRAAQQQQHHQQHQLQQHQIQQHLHRRNHSLDNAEQQLQLQQQQQQLQHHQHLLGRRGSVTSVYRPTAATTATDPMSHSYNAEGLRDAFRAHSRHNSYDNDCSPSQSGNRHQQQQQRTIDQTFAPHIVKRTPITTATTTTSTKAAAVAAATSASCSSSSKMRSKSANVTPSTIKRSSSFSTKAFVRPQSATTTKATTPKLQPRTAPNGLQKSASSNSFKNMSTARYGGVHGGGGHGHGIDDIYLNDTDNLCAQNFSSESELSDLASPTQSNGASMACGANSGGAGELLTNTRYNKAFLARLEQNKPKTGAMPASSNASVSSGGGGGGVMSQSMSAAQQQQQQQPKQGAMACPNTPELPRRDLRVRQSLRDRQSMPRDSSINRMKLDSGGGASSSLAAAKRGLMEAAAAAAATRPLAPGTPSASRVQPKYLDISKYKPQQGNTFLRRDESKSTLLPQHKEIKRSASSFGVGLGGGGAGAGGRADAVGRSSVRSVKSAVSGNSGSGAGRMTAMSTSKDEATREADLAMWRRRASYDPMKAAAEGKRKLEAKKSAHATRMGENAPNGQCVGSGVVLRSQSYHSGVGQSAAATTDDGCGDHPSDDQAPNKRWTLISTESSDEDADQLPKY